MEEDSIKKWYSETRRGLEPRTFRFRDECSDHWATDAGVRLSYIESSSCRSFQLYRPRHVLTMHALQEIIITIFFFILLTDLILILSDQADKKTAPNILACSFLQMNLSLLYVQYIIQI